MSEGAEENVGMSECCMSGVVHSGAPKGQEEKIGGLDAYVSMPEGGSKAKSVIFLTDVFGWKFNNARLLADQYAKAGFYVYIPDLFKGQALDHTLLQSVEPPLQVREQQGFMDKLSKTAKVGTNMGPFLVKHRKAVVWPLITSFTKSVKEIEGTEKVGAIGFCWGGRYSILLAHDLVDAAVACHPSLISIPGDFDPVTKPLSLAVGEKDSLLPPPKIDKIKEVMSKKKDVPSEVEVYSDQIHGFTLRGDWSSDKDKEAMDNAEKQAIAWFNKYLG